MDGGRVKVYNNNGSQDSSQDAFGWVDSSGNPTVRFEQIATIDHEGFTVGTEEQGYKTIGDITALLTSYPSGNEPTKGMEVEATDERGNTFQCVVEKWIPDGSFHGVMVLNLKER